MLEFQFGAKSQFLARLKSKKEILENDIKESKPSSGSPMRFEKMLNKIPAIRYFIFEIIDY